MSVNIKTIPLNPEGALELGMNPCEVSETCNMALSVNSTTENPKACSATCGYYDRWIKMRLEKTFGVQL